MDSVKEWPPLAVAISSKTEEEKVEKDSVPNFPTVFARNVNGRFFFNL
jgi:hypothetical protein